MEKKNNKQRKRSVVAIAVASSALFCRCGTTMLCCSQQKTNIVLPPIGLAIFCSLSLPSGTKQHKNQKEESNTSCMTMFVLVFFLSGA